MSSRAWSRPGLAWHGALLALALSARVAAAGEEAQAPPPADAVPRNVILISWDGLDRSVLRELLDAGKLPALAELIREGSLQDIEVRGHATVTKPGHAEMLTGLSARTTGVLTNTVYQPIKEGWTVFERLQQKLGREKIWTVFVASKIAHVGGRGPGEVTGPAKKRRAARRAAAGAAAADEPKGEGGAPPGADDAPAVEKKGEPFFLTKRSLDVFDVAQRTAAVTGPLCLKCLEQYKSPRFIAFLHFSDPDHAGHAHTSASPEYRQAAVTCDEWLARIVEWLKKEHLYGETLIYVVTDHGFDKNASTHSRAPHSWLATNDKAVVKGGTLADITPTILARFGVELDKLEPKLLGSPLTARPAAGTAPPARPEPEPAAAGAAAP